MKRRIIATAMLALTMAGILAWLSPEGQVVQPARAQEAAQQIEPAAWLATPKPPTAQPPHLAVEDPAHADGPQRQRGASLSTGRDSTLVPVAISTEHQELISLGSPSGQDPFHEMLEREPKDTAWAYDMEQRLRLMYEARGAQVYSIECRSKLCEVQSFGNRPEVDPRAMPPAPEPGTISPFTSSGMRVGGRSVDLAYFHRDAFNIQMEFESKRQQAQDSGQR